MLGCQLGQPAASSIHTDRRKVVHEINADHGAAEWSGVEWHCIELHCIAALRGALMSCATAGKTGATAMAQAHEWPWNGVSPETM